MKLCSQQQVKIDWPSLADSPWPVLRGNMQWTGRSEYVGPKTANVIWKADLPLGIYYGPVIGYNDILYFGTLAIDSDNRNQFYAYYPNGTEFWKYETNSWWPNELSPVAIKDGTVYMLSNILDIYALTYDGTLKWVVRVGESHGQQLSIDKAGNLYIPVKDTLKIFSPDGQILLEKRFKQISSDISFSIDGNTLYFKSGNHRDATTGYSYLNATDLQGNILWSRKFFQSNYAAPAVDNQGNIYIYGDDTLDFKKIYLFSFKPDGEVRWKYLINGYLEHSAPTIDSEGNIIFYCMKGTISLNYIVSLNYNGNVNWEYPLEHQEDDPFFAAVDHGLVCDAEGNIYFGSASGSYFYALNKAGELMWKLPLNGYEYYSSPAIGSDGTLYIGTSRSTFFQHHKENLIAVRDKTVSVEDKSVNYDFILYQNYPNPFNPTTQIKYAVGSKQNAESGKQFVTLKVYDLLGREIATLVNEPKDAGEYEIEFNADKYGLSSGVYLYRLVVSGANPLTAGSFTSTKKFVYLR